MMSSLMLRNLSFLERLMMNPRPISGTARAEMSALKPKTAMIHAVMVVPMFAPMMTPIACPRVRRPALTNPTTITVVALDDWIAAVTPKPVRTPLKGLEVIVPRSFLRPFPAVFWRPVLIMFIP